MEREEQESISIGNNNYISGNALQTRLDTSNIIYQFKLNLSGKADENYIKEDGTVGYRLISVGEPRANELGVQALTSFVSNFINTQVVQGNFYDEEMYYLAIDDLEDALRNKLLINAPKWGILDEEIQGLYDEVKSLVSTFLTRLLFNKERESYSDTIRTVENNTIRDKNGFGMFKE